MKKERTKNIRLIITGGGTGGHLFPGISLGQAMMRDYPGCKVLFIGTERKVDRTAFRNLGFETVSIKSQGIKGKKLASVFRALLLQPFAMWEAAKIMHTFKPDLVFGVGGYVTGPVILTARLMGIKTCIHEQNSIPGLANKLLGHVSNRIFVSLPGSEKFFPAKKTVLSGNPVRESIISAYAASSGKAGSAPTLLVLGGSQGARRLNSLMLEAAEIHLSGLDEKPLIIHQTGEHDEESVRKKYEAMGFKARVQAFFSDMAEIYSQADLIVSRAGATTLAEITVLHKPAILVPFPYAADNHQELNGEYLVNEGGALMFREAELTGGKLGEEISRLMADRKLLAEMSDNSGKMARPEATRTIVESCMELMKGRLTNSAGILAF